MHAYRFYILIWYVYMVLHYLAFMYYALILLCQEWRNKDVQSLLPSAKCVAKETISPSANSESFGAKMRNTPTYFPILTTFNLVANCVHFHVKWRKARNFDVRTVDSSVLKRDWGSPCWPWMTRMVSKIPQMFILSISNCEWHCPVKSAPESETMSIYV